MVEARGDGRVGAWIVLALAGTVTGFIGGMVARNDPSVVFAAQTGAGAFYRLMPHDAMATLFGAAFVYVLVALSFGAAAFWRDIGEPTPILPDPPAVFTGAHDAARLRYLDGGGGGCMTESEKPTDRRRFHHHLTFYGFTLCFMATSIATLYHFVLGREAPYPWWDLPVVLGTLGGLGMLVGPIGLAAAKLRQNKALHDATRFGMDVAFLLMLFLTAATGLALLLLRSTPGMGMLLALHLGRYGWTRRRVIQPRYSGRRRPRRSTSGQ